MATARVLDRFGDSLDLPAARWFGDVAPEEQEVLDHVVGPALDVGCGPGRHLGALAARGVPALGIDISEAVLAHARRRRVAVLRRDVFDRVPGSGRWASALLLDGNLGLGGDPVRLLRRLHGLLRADGRVLVEVDALGGPVRELCVEVDGRPGPWFPWAPVGYRVLPALAVAAGFAVKSAWVCGDRRFARLERAV